MAEPASGTRDAAVVANGSVKGPPSLGKSVAQTSTVPVQWPFTLSRVKHCSDSMNLSCTLDWRMAAPNSIEVH